MLKKPAIAFVQATGAKVLQDGPMNTAKFRTMIDGGAPDWDVTDITIDFLFSGIGDQLFEKIDRSIVDTSRLDSRFVNDYGVGCIVWSYNLGYSTKAFPGTDVPKTWADMFDLKKFPGKRTFGDNVVATLEAALMADGVAPDKLYPLDVERALKKLDTIKSQTVFWSSNSQSQQLFVDGEVTMGLILNGRAYDAAKKGAPIAISWQQNIQSVDYLVVPRGGDEADRRDDPAGKSGEAREPDRLCADQPGRFRLDRSADRAVAIDRTGQRQAGLPDRCRILARQSEEAAGAVDRLEACLVLP